MSRITDANDAALWKDPALDGLIERDTAAVLWSLDGGRVIAASSATAGLAPALRAAGGENLRGRLRRVAATLSAGSGIRLERVTLPQGYGVARLLLECHRVATQQGEFLLTILRGQLPRLPRVVEAGFDVAEATDARAPEALTLSQPGKDWRADAEQAVSEPNPVERLFAFAGQRAMVRFIWECDAEGRITRVSQDLAGLVGRVAGRIEGKLWRELVSEGIVHDPQQAVSSMLTQGEGARHVSWSGLEVLWRIGDAKAFPLLPVELAGIPIHDARGGFQGYRGFGLARVGRLRQSEGGDTPHKQVSAKPKQAKETAYKPLEQKPLLEERASINIEAEVAPEPREATARGKLSDSEKQAFRDIARALAKTSAHDEEITSAALTIAEQDVRAEKPTLRAIESLREDRDVVTAPSAEKPQPETPVPARNRRRAARLRLVEPDQPAANDPLPISSPADDIWTVPQKPADDIWIEQDPLPDQPANSRDVSSKSVAAAKGRAKTDTTSAFVHVADRLPLGLLVSRGSEVLFVNRALLDLLGYDHLEYFIAAGGLRALFMGAPGAGDAPLSLRTSKGVPVAADARMATVQWEGRAATLMSFRRAMEPQAEAHLRALERELRQQEARVRALDTILDTAADGIVTLDGAGRLMSLNSSAEALLGCEETEVVGAPFWHLLTPESREEASAYFDGLRAGGLASVLNDGISVTARAQHGGDVPLMMIMGKLATYPLPQETHGDDANADKAQRYFAILRDISVPAPKEPAVPASSDNAGQVARQAEFLARVSHEIRTPLNAIIGFTEIMLEERFGPIGAERYREYLADIHASGSHVISLVNDLLDLARIESGRLELAPAHLALNDVVSGCVALMMPQASREQVVLRTSLANRLPSIKVNERALQQIILNLLSNAIKFTDAGGQVIVSTAHADDGSAVLRIRDTGIGMTQAQVTAAMEPFSHLTTTRLGHGEGSGLGLPLTRALVEASGGRFHIASKRHEGTLVEIAFLPLREPVDTSGQVKLRPASQ